MLAPHTLYTITVRLRNGTTRKLPKRWNYYNTIEDLEKTCHRTEKGARWEVLLSERNSSRYQEWISKKNNVQTDIYKEYTCRGIRLGTWIMIQNNNNSLNEIRWYRDTITEFNSMSDVSPLHIYTPLIIEYLQGPMNRDPHAPSWTYPQARFIHMDTPIEDGFALVSTQGRHIRFVKSVPLPSGESTAEQ